MDAKKLKALEGFFANDVSDVPINKSWFDRVILITTTTPLTSINTSPEIVDNLVKALSDVSKGKYDPSKYKSIQIIEELWRNIYQSRTSTSLDALLKVLETVTDKGYSLSSSEETTYTTMKTGIEMQRSFLVNVKDILDTSPASNVSEERVGLETSDTRSDQARHPDHGVGFYEGSRVFPMTRPMSAIWLCSILAISMFFILLALGIFLRFAHIEIDIKTPFGGGVASTVAAIGDTPPIQYTTVIGGAAAVGIVGAYIYYLLKPRVVSYLKL